MQVKVGNQYKTRHGKPVVIYATGLQGTSPVHGAVLEDECWGVCDWGSDGKFNGTDCKIESDYDLIEVKPRIHCELWANVYKNGSGFFIGTGFDDKEVAIRVGKENDAIACVKVTIDCEEGEGL